MINAEALLAAGRFEDANAVFADFLKLAVQATDPSGSEFVKGPLPIQGEEVERAMLWYAVSLTMSRNPASHLEALAMLKGSASTGHASRSLLNLLPKKLLSSKLLQEAQNGPVVTSVWPRLLAGYVSKEVGRNDLQDYLRAEGLSDVDSYQCDVEFYSAYRSAIHRHFRSKDFRSSLGSCKPQQFEFLVGRVVQDPKRSRTDDENGPR